MNNSSEQQEGQQEPSTFMDLEAADDDDASRTDNDKEEEEEEEEEEDGLPDILTLAEGHPGREFASTTRFRADLKLDGPLGRQRRGWIRKAEEESFPMDISTLPRARLLAELFLIKHELSRRNI
ncbi:hypothetical protein THAOC_30305 [Thalassiosira oceanica]|uniref:Uncharacterized protein n=1 Tax=Thalassiosira oceanica TaxID=159749 RepID=K0RP47_THAOC|nr:hypothetical protein THAOC_30305 [Thalassiosira oceanica]|eukprot:EJK50656.1 hypothetical protein THAOC_30305 [Thalassiosira oceanica]